MSDFVTDIFKTLFSQVIYWGFWFALAYSLDQIEPSIKRTHAVDVILWLFCAYISTRLLYLQVRAIQIYREMQNN